MDRGTSPSFATNQNGARSRIYLESEPLVMYELIDRAGVITIQHFFNNIINEHVRRMISFYLKKANNDRNAHFIVIVANPVLEGFSVGIDLEEAKDNIILMPPSSSPIINTNYNVLTKIGVPPVNVSFTSSCTNSLRNGASDEVGGKENGKALASPSAKGATSLPPSQTNLKSTDKEVSPSLGERSVEGRSPTTTTSNTTSAFNAVSGLNASIAGNDYLSLNDVCCEIEMSKKLVVVALHGAVIGGGLELALSAHCRIATQDAFFGFPEVKLGFLPTGGGTQRLPRLVGIRHAFSLLCEGHLIGVDEAASMGLVDAVVEVERMDRIKSKLLLTVAVAYGTSIIQEGKLRLYTRQKKNNHLNRTFTNSSKLLNVFYNCLFFNFARRALIQEQNVSVFKLYALQALNASTKFNSPQTFSKGLIAEYEALASTVNTPAFQALQYFLKNLQSCRTSIPLRFKLEYKQKRRNGGNAMASRSNSEPPILSPSRIATSTPPRSPSYQQASTIAPPAGTMSIRRVAVLGCTPKALRRVAFYLFHHVPVLIIPCSIRHMNKEESAQWMPSLNANASTGGKKANTKGKAAGASSYNTVENDINSPTHIDENDLDISHDKTKVARFLEGYLAEMVIRQSNNIGSHSSFAAAFRSSSGHEPKAGNSSNGNRNIYKKDDRLNLSDEGKDDDILLCKGSFNTTDRAVDAMSSLLIEMEDENIPQLKRPFRVEEIFRVQQCLQLFKLISPEDDQILLVQDVDLIINCGNTFLSSSRSIKATFGHYFNSQDERAYAGVLRFLFTRLDSSAKNNCVFLFDNYENLIIAKKQLSEFRHSRLFMYYAYIPQPSPTPAEAQIKMIEISCTTNDFSVQAMEALQNLYGKMGNITLFFTRSLPVLKKPYNIPPAGVLTDNLNQSDANEESLRSNTTSTPIQNEDNAKTTEGVKKSRPETATSGKKKVLAPATRVGKRKILAVPLLDETQMSPNLVDVSDFSEATPNVSYFTFSGIRLFARGLYQLLVLLEHGAADLATIESSLQAFGFKQGCFLTCQGMGLEEVWYEICLQHYEQTMEYLLAQHAERDKNDDAFKNVDGMNVKEIRHPMNYVCTLPAVSELIVWMILNKELFYKIDVIEVELKESKLASKTSKLLHSYSKNLADIATKNNKGLVSPTASNENFKVDFASKTPTVSSTGTPTASDVDETASSLSPSPAPSPPPPGKTEDSSSTSLATAARVTDLVHTSAKRTKLEVQLSLNIKVVEKLRDIRKTIYTKAHKNRLPFSLYTKVVNHSVDQVDIQHMVLATWIQEAVHLFQGYRQGDDQPAPMAEMDLSISLTSAGTSISNHLSTDKVDNQLTFQLPDDMVREVAKGPKEANTVAKGNAEAAAEPNLASPTTPSYSINKNTPYSVGRSSDIDMFSVLVLKFPAWRGGIHFYGVCNMDNSLFIMNRFLTNMHRDEKRAFELMQGDILQQKDNSNNVSLPLRILNGLLRRANGNEIFSSLSFAPYYRVWKEYPSSLMNEVSNDLRNYTALLEEEQRGDVLCRDKIFTQADLKMCELRNSAHLSKEEFNLTTPQKLKVTFNTTKLDIWE